MKPLDESAAATYFLRPIETATTTEVAEVGGLSQPRTPPQPSMHTLTTLPENPNLVFACDTARFVVVCPTHGFLIHEKPATLAETVAFFRQMHDEEALIVHGASFSGWLGSISTALTPENAD